MQFRTLSDLSRLVDDEPNNATGGYEQMSKFTINIPRGELAKFSRGEGKLEADQLADLPAWVEKFQRENHTVARVHYAAHCWGARQIDSLARELQFTSKRDYLECQREAMRRRPELVPLITGDLEHDADRADIVLREAIR